MSDQAEERGAALAAEWLGRRPFDEALALQLEAREQLVAGRGEPVLFLVEHPPAVTLGRRASREDLLWSEQRFAEDGVGVYDTPRGGQATLHAPGQLVVYPVLHVGRYIRAHIVRLADVAIALLEELGVSGSTFRMDHPGVWIGARKIASIGIHVSRGVTVQGLSLNLDVDSQLFDALVSCGLKDVEIISARDVGARPISIEDAARRYAELFAASLDRPLRWRDPA
ncbi:MAG: lipoyl(octanoyl) transferase LipB [Myxococcales bacterium]|nr:lipoyl(octanoyl) transferase LipB [Myxococcales bacterium]